MQPTRLDAALSAPTFQFRPLQRGLKQLMIFPASGERQQHRYTFPASAWFEYHCWESEDSADAEIWGRTHERVTVLRMLSPNESDLEMYEVQFADGHKAIVFADELMRTRKNFERPDYQSPGDSARSANSDRTKASNH